MSYDVTRYVYGEETMQLHGESLNVRRDGLDEVSQEWVSPNPNLFSTGGTVPGYTNMQIDSFTRSDDNGEYLYRLNGVGLAGSRARRRERGYPKITLNEESFDEAVDSWLQNGTDNFTMGSTLSGYSTMYLLTKSEEPLHGNFYRIQPRYVGIIGSKPYKRRISVNGQIVQPGDPIINNLPGAGGGGSPQNWQFQLPKVVVSDYRIQVGGPPTTAIPGNSTPPDAPSISTLVGFTGIPVTYVWPDGWSFASIDGDYIAGTNIWAGTYNYEYNWPAIPN